MAIIEKSKLIWTRIYKSPKNQDFRWLYEGQVLNNKPHGFGVLIKMHKDEKCHKHYAGNWIEGKKCGFGGCWYDNGDYYEGDFCDNKRHGFGRMWYENGSFYQGSWDCNLYDGDGLLINNGNRYEGRFKLGKKDGVGIFCHLNTGQIQEGFWSNDNCKSSVIQDVAWRQSAFYATPYPIPKLANNKKETMDNK